MVCGLSKVNQIVPTVIDRFHLPRAGLDQRFLGASLAIEGVKDFS